MKPGRWDPTWYVLGAVCYPLDLTWFQVKFVVQQAANPKGDAHLPGARERIFGYFGSGLAMIHLVG
jgi:hypothetical protein